mmetsp:Transcript_91302/g.293242  ORF Transcript_91302/g.293242 Transcript_91302/m.293242 type:complete len:257 (+) Transcript_91302:48-818(+)
MHGTCPRCSELSNGGHLRLAAPPRHHHLRVAPRPVLTEDPRPLLLQMPDGLPLALACRVPLGASTTFVPLVHHAEQQAVAPKHRAVLVQVRRGEVVVLLEPELRVESARRPVVHEEVTQDKVLGAQGNMPQGHPRVAQWEYPSQLRLLRRGPHPRQQVPRRGHRREPQLLSALCRGVALEHVFADLLRVVIVESDDVVAQLHAGLLLFGGVGQREIPRLAQSSPLHGVQPQAPIGLHGLLVDIPNWLCAAHSTSPR